MHGGGDEVPKFGLTRTSSISWLGVMIDMLPGDSVGYDCISVSLGHKENVMRKYTRVPTITVRVNSQGCMSTARLWKTLSWGRPLVVLNLDKSMGSPAVRACTGNHNISPVRRFWTFCCSIAVHGGSEKMESSIRACGIYIEILIIVAHGGGPITLAQVKAFAELNVSPKPRYSSFR